MKTIGLLFLATAASFSGAAKAAGTRTADALADRSAWCLAEPAAASSLPCSSSFSKPKPVSTPYHPAILRRHYEQATSDKAAGEKFYKLLADYKDRDALVLAYKAAAEAIRARDASMLNKLTYVQDAARTFDQAVGLDPQNPEIRFLRFSVESNLPAFLGLSKHVDEDKERLLDAAFGYPNSGLDAEAFRTVRNFLVDRGHITEEQAQRLSKVAE